MTRGGKRTGAGRPKGTGKYNEETRVMRVPESRVMAVKSFLRAKPLTAPLYSSRVQAGSPTPGDDHVEAQLNLHDHLIRTPDETFFLHASGNSMVQAGIFDGDLMVVDRSLPATEGKIVIAMVDGELTVKEFTKGSKGSIVLKAHNPEYSDITVQPDQDFHIWGVVTNVVHALGGH